MNKKHESVHLATLPGRWRSLCPTRSCDVPRSAKALLFEVPAMPNCFYSISASSGRRRNVSKTASRSYSERATLTHQCTLPGTLCLSSEPLTTYRRLTRGQTRIKSARATMHGRSGTATKIAVRFSRGFLQGFAWHLALLEVGAAEGAQQKLQTRGLCRRRGPYCTHHMIYVTVFA